MSPIHKRRDSTLDAISSSQYLKSQNSAATVVLHVNVNALDDTEV